MNYCYFEFLEFFDTEKVIDEQAGEFEYSICKNDLQLTVSMEIYDEKVCFQMTSKAGTNLISFCLRGIDTILCDKSNNKVRFLFYKSGKYVPIVCLYIQPFLSLLLDIEHTADVYSYPCRH